MCVCVCSRTINRRLQRGEHVSLLRVAVHLVYGLDGVGRPVAPEDGVLEDSNGVWVVERLLEECLVKGNYLAAHKQLIQRTTDVSSGSRS